VAFQTKADESYIVGIRADEVRTQRCAGNCGSRVYVSEEAWKSAREFARDKGIHPSRVKAVCRRCLAQSQAIPQTTPGRGLIL